MTERTAEEWGRVAVSLPGWRWPRGLRDNGVPPQIDDWAWEGWLLRVLSADDCSVVITRNGGTFLVQCFGALGRGATLGRACIAVAVALGRWPGGGE